MPSNPPAWLSLFANSVVQELDALLEFPAVGCHYALAEDYWEVTLFPASAGPESRADARRSPAPLSVDVTRMSKLFSRVDLVRWQSRRMGAGDDLGAHLSVEGEVAGRAVWLRILSRSPARIPARIPSKLQVAQ